MPAKKATSGKKAQTTGKGKSAAKRLAVLRATLTVSYPGLKKQKPQERLRNSLLDSLLGGGSEMSVEVLANPEAQRLEILHGPKRSTTIVFREGRPESFWDSELRVFADLRETEPPLGPIGASRDLRLRKETGKGQAKAEVRGRDETLGEVRHEFEFSQAEAHKPFADALFKVLFCCRRSHAQSQLPYEELVGMGCLTAARTYLGEDEEPFSEVKIELGKPGEAEANEFEPPAGYRSLQEHMAKETNAKPAGKPPIWPVSDPPKPKKKDSGQSRQALDFVVEDLTPECMRSTRFGAMAGTLHQDLLDDVSSAINTVAPLLGTAAIGGGTCTVRWLASLAAINAASGTAAGSGIFTFLRDPRTVTLPPGIGPGTGGGMGLLDKLAFKFLYELDGSGLMRTQREAATTTGTPAVPVLFGTLVKWGLSPITGVGAALVAAGGNLLALTLPQQRAIVEAYETSELGVFTLSGLPTSMGPFSFGSFSVGPVVVLGVTILPGYTSPNLMDVSITGITGTVNFASLAGGPLVTAAKIGSTGNITLTLALPTITLNATVARSLTVAGLAGVVTGGVGAAAAFTALVCAAMPLLCPVAATIATLVLFVMNNVTGVTAVGTGVGVTLDIEYKFDPATGSVAPFVSVLASTGAITVTTHWVTPQIIANVFDDLVAGLGNLFGAWQGLVLGEVAKAVEQGLRAQGMELPVAGRQLGLQAVDGNAISNPGEILQLSVDVGPVPGVASQPYTTQVAPSDVIANNLQNAHVVMRHDLNPQVPPPPGPGAALTVGTYAGIGVSQNALNYYIFDQWVQGRFNVNLTSPGTIGALMGLAPPNLFQGFPTMVHLWPATPPRVETAPAEVAQGRRPLVVFFDDVRACFETPVRQVGDHVVRVSWELCFNVKTTGTVRFSWPWVFDLFVDAKSPAPSPSEVRSWEWIDANVPAVMNQLTPAALGPMADLLARELLLPMDVSGLSLPETGAPAWNRPFPAVQEEIFPALVAAPLKPQRGYLELLEQRKALYVLPAFQTQLLELVDGSGAPDLKLFSTPPGMGATGATSLLAMTRTQGVALRGNVLGIFPPGP